MGSKELNEETAFRAVSIGKLPLIDDEVLRAIGPDSAVVVNEDGRCIDLLVGQDIDDDVKAMSEIFQELKSARSHFEPFHSPHEGASILREEYEELWDEVRANKRHTRPTSLTKERMRKEAIQVAAMAIRFIRDICDRK